jgi:hypothetical protein
VRLSCRTVIFLIFIGIVIRKDFPLSKIPHSRKRHR